MKEGNQIIIYDGGSFTPDVLTIIRFVQYRAYYDKYEYYNVTQAVDGVVYKGHYKVPKSKFEAWKKLNKEKIVEIKNPNELKKHISEYLEAHPTP